MNRRGSAAVVLVLGLVPGAAEAATPRVVGPGRAYAKPCQAIAAAAAGDTVQIDASGNGSYDGDVCSASVPNLTIEGVHGRARIDAAARSSGGKAIWVLSGPNTVVRNVELSRQASPCRDAGTPDVPTGLPAEQYVYDLGREGRTVVGGAPDAGAFEWARRASVVTLGGRSVKSDGSVRLTLNVARPGAVTATATTRSVAYAQAAARAHAAGRVVVTLEPTAAGKKALRSRKRLTLTLTIRFKPTGGGTAVTRRSKVTIKRTKAGARGLRSGREPRGRSPADAG